MRVITPAGETIELGTTETGATIGIIDYSRRVTDDYGVTTVVERGFARKMSVRLKVPFEAVDGVQRRLADLRATSALWVADDRFATLRMQGFYKDFSIDLATPPNSYCSLSVEGLATSDPVSDSGGDPAPDGQASTLQLLQPVRIAGGMLVASNVDETDYPEWSAGTAYGIGARVIRSATHRIYESTAAGNAGNPPGPGSTAWFDVGATNRWAMFDEALGSVTFWDGMIAVTIAPQTAVDGIALLDVTADRVRVQAAGYDRTVVPTARPGSALFLDLPAGSGNVTVTVTGGGTVTVGTLLIGRRRRLGITGASPTAGITDYSRKVVDDFGEVTIVERAWAKKMSAKALIRTDAVDVVFDRIAAVRARPSLWIGQAGIDSLTIYGFFKDFSIEVAAGVSTLSLSIEGLSRAAPIAPPIAPGNGSVEWPDVKDTDGKKPADNADVTEDALPGLLPDALPFAYQKLTWRSPTEIDEDLNGAIDTLAEATLRNEVFRGELMEKTTRPDGTDIYQYIDGLGLKTDQHEAFVALMRAVGTDGSAKFGLIARGDGGIVGIEGFAQGNVRQLSFVSSQFLFTDNSGTVSRNAMVYVNGKWIMHALEVDTLKVNTAVAPVRVVAGSYVAGKFATQTGFAEPRSALLTAAIVVPVAGWVEITAKFVQGQTAGNGPWSACVAMNGVDDTYSLIGDGLSQANNFTQGSFYCPAPGTYTITLQWAAYTGVQIRERSLFIKFFPFTE
ncbi:hypothetical protein [Sphingomonas prati]|uniref:Uncharacterized protein n=1 Tax=Sphingomonas prati TaxID=1843237 RepID=A0A7W9BQJ2_9SPHN|nr:hypothetical protein [Sphingomonas prati]MBB5728262.1 hypothetical protein [Sphingomonas prati]GGE75177.1 hypothetical protein GCM10011404_04680 [Sphingomonas prati]